MRENYTLEELLNTLAGQATLSHIQFQKPRTTTLTKASIRPILIQNQLHYQITTQVNTQSLHVNLTQTDLISHVIQLMNTGFKQAILYTQDSEYHVLTNNKGKITILKKPVSETLIENSNTPLPHNRKKNYILQDGIPIPFLIELGIMNTAGKVLAKKYDKFKQINRFLDMIQDCLPALDLTQRIHIVDFGCGKSYLTFALYHYLANIHQLSLKVVGLDLKSEVIKDCSLLAQKLGFNDLSFFVNDIEHYHSEEPIDMVVVLHACNTATDAALEKAVQWKAKVILAVPCCQHELYNQIKNNELYPLFKHGIIKERIAALTTDALRAQLLEILGYKTQILEFIDMEHTPKNLLIRAIRYNTVQNTHHLKKLIAEYRTITTLLNVNPDLGQRFKEELEMHYHL